MEIIGISDIMLPESYSKGVRDVHQNKILMMRGTRRALRRKSEVTPDNAEKIRELSKIVMEQLIEKLEAQNRRVLKKLEEVEKLADKYYAESKAEKQILKWREDYKVIQKQKQNKLFSRIIDQIKNWSA